MLPRPTTHSKALGPGVVGPELAVPSSHPLALPPGAHPQVPLSGAQPFMVDPSMVDASGGHRQRTQYPYVTGTSVLGVVYADGILIACDTLGAYGSTKRYKSLERVKKVNDRCVVAASGEISDFQQIMKYLDELVLSDFTSEDCIELGPREVYNYLTRVMYNRWGCRGYSACCRGGGDGVGAAVIKHVHTVCGGVGVLHARACMCLRAAASVRHGVWVAHKPGNLQRDAFPAAITDAPTPCRSPPLNYPRGTPGATRWTRCGIRWWWGAWRMASPSWAQWA